MPPPTATPTDPGVLYGDPSCGPAADRLADLRRDAELEQARYAALDRTPLEVRIKVEDMDDDDCVAAFVGSYDGWSGLGTLEEAVAWVDAKLREVRLALRQLLEATP